MSKKEFTRLMVASAIEASSNTEKAKEYLKYGELDQEEFERIRGSKIEELKRRFKEKS